MKTVILSIAIAMFISCNRDKTEEIVQDQLPPITSYGANTAGCIINGKVLIPKNGSQAIGGSPVYGMNVNAGINFNGPISGNDYWQLEIANKKDTNGAGIILYIKNMSSGVGDYIVDQSNGELYMDGPNNNQMIASIRENGITKTYWSSNNTSTIKITRFDFYNGIYSGVFSAKLYNKDNPSEKIQITDGRFDIKIATLNK
ncbi:hypothetical protein [Amniculibacterium sp. G2-70]|uniref:hypothetical protein n=1 Tax=Amniculibacterium sp. G2-70 TaxID=2767188 RepID=UPI0016548783|nr:hypothetical protein [Amniculibacterium sp. G2-70]